MMDKIEKMSYEEFITFQTYNDKLIENGCPSP